MPSRLPTPLAAGLAAVLASACVAKDSDTLGELDDASTSPQGSGSADDGDGDGNDDGDDGATSGASDGGDAGDDAATTAMTSAGDDGEPPPLMCEPGLDWTLPASCPTRQAPQLPAAGCYEECTGEGDACAVGTCRLVEVDPCPCPPDAEACCGACAGEAWLCVESVVDTACEAIVGTTFESIDELECGLGKKGPVLCHWRLEFGARGDFLWMHSDVGEGGSYTCENGVITTDALAQPIEHSFDPKSQILTWDGVDYQPVAP